MKHAQHPLSAAFPAMHEADFLALVEDIRQHGQRDPATTLDGMVIDGWHRYRACEQIGLPCRTEELAANDPVAFVLSKNLHRRQLTASQRAAAVVAASAWAQSGDNQHTKRGGEPGSPPPSTNREMAFAGSVDERTVQQAKRAAEAGIGDAVRDGKISAKKAAEIAKLPESERAEAVDKAAAGQGIADAKAKPAEHPPMRDDDEMEDMRKMLAEATADNEMMARIFEADDKLAEAMSKIEKLTEQNRLLESRINGLIGEKDEATRHAIRWKKAYDSLLKGKA